MSLTKQYREYTQAWQNVFQKQDALQICNYLNDGFSFHITYEEYMKMKDSDPENIHYYFGLSPENKFTILIIDSVSDEKQIHDNVLLKELSYNMTEINNHLEERKIPSKIALQRSFRWKFMAENWINYMANEFAKKRPEEIAFYPLITLKFENFKDVFKTDPKNVASHFFGLGKRGLGGGKSLIDDHSNYILDLIITNLGAHTKEETFANVSWPWDLPMNASGKERDKEAFEKMFTSGKYSLLPKR